MFIIKNTVTKKYLTLILLFETVNLITVKKKNAIASWSHLCIWRVYEYKSISGPNPEGLTQAKLILVEIKPDGLKDLVSNL